MGLDITVGYAEVQPEAIIPMQKGESYGCGLLSGTTGKVLVTMVDEAVYYRRIYTVRDVLCKALRNRSESEYHLLTPRRILRAIALTERKIDELNERGERDAYFDEVPKLREFRRVLHDLYATEREEPIVAIWG
jgi:hypothetical protein